MREEDELKEKIKETEAILYSYLLPEEGYEVNIYRAMNYSIKAGGKRLRPILMREVYRVFGGKDTVIEPFMSAIEMIHTYSLVHDDLPAMDNDDLRRGKPTTHKAFGEAMGVLCGDGLLNAAMERVMSAFYMEPDPARHGRIIKAIRLLFTKSGVHGMIGGQVVDVEG